MQFAAWSVYILVNINDIGIVGAGFNVSVSVNSNGENAETKFLLSYAAPKITSLLPSTTGSYRNCIKTLADVLHTGCQSVPNNTMAVMECNRNGQDVITL